MQATREGTTGAVALVAWMASAATWWMAQELQGLQQVLWVL